MKSNIRMFPAVFCCFIVHILVSCVSGPEPEPLPEKEPEREVPAEKIEEIPEEASLSQAELNEELFKAVFAEDYPRAEELLTDGAEINAGDPEGWTILMRVLEDPRLGPEPVQFVLEHGGEVNTHVDWISPVFIAAVSGKEESLNLLKDHGGIIDFIVEKERNVLMQVVDFPRLEKEQRENAVLLLLQYGADPNWRDQEGQTPLIQTIQRKRSPVIVKQLLEFGAHPDLRGPEKLTPLMAAALESSPKIVVISILNAGGNLKLELPGRSNAMDMALAGLNMEFLAAVREYQSSR